MILHTRLLFFLLLLSGFGLTGDGRPPSMAEAEFQAVLKRTGEELAETHGALELARTRARALERSAQPGAWAQDWERTRPSRGLIHARYGQLERRLQSAAIEQTAERQGLHRQLLTDWVRAGEPVLIRAQLQKGAIPLKERSGLGLRAADRRDLLHAVLLREAATPGHDDLDALVEVLEWEVLLLDDSRGPHLQQLSTDLILLFTDRAADGFALSGAGYYDGGLFLDRGLRVDLKDASNQLRHLCWALRLFSISKDPDATQKLLRFKEQRDALQRKLPLNQADLRLNRCARELVERMNPEDSPLALSEVPALFRAALGPVSHTEPGQRQHSLGVPILR